MAYFSDKKRGTLKHLYIEQHEISGRYALDHLKECKEN